MYPQKREAEGEKIDKRRRRCDHQGEEQSDVATSQGIGSHQRLEGARARLCSQPLEGALPGGLISASDTDFRLWPPEVGENKFRLF